MREFNLQQFIISIIIIGVVLVVGIYITSSIQDVTYATGTIGSAINESVTPTALGIYTLPGDKKRSVSCGAITSVNNQTNNIVITAGNYTQTGCSVSNATAICTGCSAVWKFTYPYTYSADTNASVSAGNVTTALATGTSWISILVVVGFATIILTMLTSGLGRAAAEQATPYY